MSDGLDMEWLEADGLGGYAMGPVCGARTRRYHGLLIAATTPPTGRQMLLNGFDAWVQTPAGRYSLAAQRYERGEPSPRPDAAIEMFDLDPWPRWRLRLPDGTIIEHELFMRHSHPLTVLSWRLVTSERQASLIVRPFLSGRDAHALQRQNAEFRFQPVVSGSDLTWRMYDSPGVPGLVLRSNGHYRHEPHWYRDFLYTEERARGFDALEDLASPGTLQFDLSRGEGVIIAAADTAIAEALPRSGSPLTLLRTLRERERHRRSTFATPLHRAADDYIVTRGSHKTIVAGYPWFTDWGRDTFIALRGLCLATGRLDDARQILLAWAATISRGMLPNRFPDSGGEPEFNSVDASLWYVIAVHDFMEAARGAEFEVDEDTRARFRAAVLDILAGYAEGTRFNIHRDEDGLLAAGVRGQQLTWMDARVGDHEITPRIGKPIEVNALWLNACWVGSRYADRWRQAFLQGRQSFRRRFWNPARGWLNDVVDVDHVPGTIDETLRPNQVLAIGGLPMPLLDEDQARSVLAAIEERLLTPLGLRTLSPYEPGYIGRYAGGPTDRDGAYHQGTVWPWLIGAFAEAWVRLQGGTAAARRQARVRFLEPLLKHASEAGLGHVSEIVDGDAPHAPRGCPFQAWSLGELIRLQAIVLAEAPGAVQRDEQPARAADESPATQHEDAPCRAMRAA